MALTSLISAITGSLNFTGRKTVLGISGSFAEALSKSISLTHGTGLDKNDQVYWTKSATIAPSGTLVVDLATFTDPFGDALTMSKIKAIYISNESAVAIVDFGAGTAPVVVLKDAASDKVPIQPGGVFLLATNAAAGVGVITATTADKITITNASGTDTATVTLVIVGCSA